MSYLVDTNAWIAFFEDSPKLSNAAAEILESAEVQCYVSIASIWEAAIKVGIGKLQLPYDLKTGLPGILEDCGFELLPVELDDVVLAKDLEAVHGDPFDRIQVIQAQRRGLRIISRDPVFERYGLRRVW
ncbi:type II toxin-antitoxin system VapC family toxin [Coraliomargarita parva]|uniref:type II toxin-antitoxin system VapC family toxin n=1 Tax=Coraliomargarita parva TaxID=3014050 RepID=UPI0022B360F2|nr:type II toxin-antitoxin system VapC family toxin [Coraliomargarita parva]